MSRVCPLARESHLMNSSPNQPAVAAGKVALLRFLLAKNPAPEAHQFAALAIDEFLGPLFFEQLKATQSPMPETPALRELTADADEMLMRHVLQDYVLLEAHRALKAANIQCIWLKGAALSHLVYEKPYTRIKRDLDCLVSKDDFPRALEILLQVGYSELDEGLEMSFRERLSYHSHLIYNQYPNIRLELHHSLLGPRGQSYLSPEQLKRWIQHLIPFQIEGETCFCFRPEQHFLYLCAHAFLQHGEADIYLRDLLDMHLLITKTTFDWDVLLEESRALEWSYLLHYALTRVQAYFPTPIPPAVMDTLALEKSKPEIVQAVLWKREGDIRGELILELLGHLSFQEKIKTIWQIAFPSPDYMRERYAIPENTAVLPYYGKRTLELSKGMMRTLARRLQYQIKPPN